MSGFVKSKSRVTLTPGASVRIAREILGWSQNDLAQESDIPQSTISAIESDRIALGVERAERLALAMSVHPAVLLFPHWPMSAKISTSKISELKRQRSKKSASTL